MSLNVKQDLTVIVQARMSSTRLPKKVLLPFGQSTVLECLVDRVRRANSVSRIIIATSNERSDDWLADFITTKNFAELYRGSLQNVFSRYQEIAKQIESKYFIRITADCPLVCPNTIDAMLHETKHLNTDFCSNSHKEGIIKGFDLELFSRDLILSIDSEQLSSYDLEHVTPIMYQAKKESVHLIKYNLEPYMRDLNLSIDTKRDYELLQKLEFDFQVSAMSYAEIMETVLPRMNF
jgi:spore coat polysaccharide biosynthesis protein SpsF